MSTEYQEKKITEKQKCLKKYLENMAGQVSCADLELKITPLLIDREYTPFAPVNLSLFRPIIINNKPSKELTLPSSIPSIVADKKELLEMEKAFQEYALEVIAKESNKHTAGVDMGRHSYFGPEYETAKPYQDFVKKSTDTDKWPENGFEKIIHRFIANETNPESPELESDVFAAYFVIMDKHNKCYVTDSQTGLAREISFEEATQIANILKSFREAFELPTEYFNKIQSGSKLRQMTIQEISDDWIKKVQVALKKEGFDIEPTCSGMQRLDISGREKNQENEQGIRLTMMHSSIKLNSPRFYATDFEKEIPSNQYRKFALRQLVNGALSALNQSEESFVQALKSNFKDLREKFSKWDSTITLDSKETDLYLKQLLGQVEKTLGKLLQHYTPQMLPDFGEELKNEIQPLKKSLKCKDGGILAVENVVRDFNSLMEELTKNLKKLQPKEVKFIPLGRIEPKAPENQSNHNEKDGQDVVSLCNALIESICDWKLSLEEQFKKDNSNKDTFPPLLTEIRKTLFEARHLKDTSQKNLEKKTFTGKFSEKIKGDFERISNKFSIQKRTDLILVSLEAQRKRLFEIEVPEFFKDSDQSLIVDLLDYLKNKIIETHWEGSFQERENLLKSFESKLDCINSNIDRYHTDILTKIRVEITRINEATENGTTILSQPDKFLSLVNPTNKLSFPEIKETLTQANAELCKAFELKIEELRQVFENFSTAVKKENDLPGIGDFKYNILDKLRYSVEDFKKTNPNAGTKEELTTIQYTLQDLRTTQDLWERKLEVSKGMRTKLKSLKTELENSPEGSWHKDLTHQKVVTLSSILMGVTGATSVTEIEKALETTPEVLSKTRNWVLSFFDVKNGTSSQTVDEARDILAAYKNALEL